MSTIPLSEALRLYIQEKHECPVITEYDINRYLFTLYQTKEINGLKIGKISLDFPDVHVIANAIGKLIRSGFIKRIDCFSAYEISNSKIPSSYQVVCAINPFCYLSHISAMDWHGLTDRIPKQIHITTCSAIIFSRLMNEKISGDFGNYRDKVKFKIKKKLDSYSINDKEIIEHEKSKFTNRKSIDGTGGVRVASIGETFLSMIQDPELCGGINHVLDVFDEFAKTYKPLILKEVDINGSKIDKCRVGYIFEEMLKINDKKIDEWASSAVSRGGSRKLVASKSYCDTYSERWCISINN